MITLPNNVMQATGRRFVARPSRLWYPRPVAPRPAVPRSDLELVARALASGRRQTQIAVEQGWHKQKVQRCVAQLRQEVALESGRAWLDTTQRTATEVAQEWLRLQEQPPSQD